MTHFVQYAKDQIINMALFELVSVLDRDKDGQPTHIRFTFSGEAGRVDFLDVAERDVARLLWDIAERMAFPAY